MRRNEKVGRTWFPVGAGVFGELNAINGSGSDLPIGDVTAVVRPLTEYAEQRCGLEVAGQTVGVFDILASQSTGEHGLAEVSEESRFGRGGGGGRRRRSRLRAQSRVVFDIVDRRETALTGVEVGRFKC